MNIDHIDTGGGAVRCAKCEAEVERKSWQDDASWWLVAARFARDHQHEAGEKK